MPTHGEMLPPGARDEFAIRFHLHPSVKASRIADGHAAMLVLPNKDVWTFESHEDRVELEESVFLGGTDGPRRAVQLVIYGHARAGLARALDFHAYTAHTSRRPQAQRGCERPHSRKTTSRRTNPNCRCNSPLPPLKGRSPRKRRRPASHFYFDIL